MSAIKKAQLYLAVHFRESILLEDMAREAGLSKFHFHRLFKYESGFTPLEYLLKLRMEYAAHFMVLYSGCSMSEVAFESGFTSPACFSRSFRKYYGVNPLTFRKQKEIPASGIASVNQRLEVTYMPAKKIRVEKIPLRENTLTEAYNQLLSSSPTRQDIWGFYLDVPFHVPQDECRYYAGKEISRPSSEKSCLTIPSGYYVSIRITGNFDTLRSELTHLRDRIGENGYRIDSLIGYERIQSDGVPIDQCFFDRNRELFVKVKRM